MMAYRLIRSQRKTLSIEISKDAELLVRAPFRLSQKQIEHFLEQKQDWIAVHIEKMKQRAECREQFDINQMKKLLLLGKEYPVTYGKKACFDGQQFVLPKENTKQVLISLYKQFAKQVVQQRITLYSEKMDCYPSSVKINSAQKRWGSCSGKNGLNFSWLLIMAPLEAVDYVVVHELAHIKQHNHSKFFWTIVEQQLVDYKQREKMLKQLQLMLQTQNWK